MDFKSICRTCLGTKSLNPIFKNKKQHEMFSVAMINTTGLNIQLNDGLPQNICILCMSYINSCLKFRAKCKDAEITLLQIRDANKVESTDTEEIENTDTKEIKTEDLHVKKELDYNSDDDKPLIDLFENEVEKKEESEQLEIKENLDDKSNITIVETKLIDVNKLKREIEKKRIRIDNVDHTPITIRNTVNVGIEDADRLNKVKIDDAKVIKKKTKRVTCRICKKSLSVRSVDKHMGKAHPGADESKEKCDVCDTYLLKMKMKRHLSMMHGKKCSICSYCKLEFFNKDSLQAHVASCPLKKKARKQDSSKEMSECETCNKKMQKASLRMHIKIKHAGLGPVCSHCGRKFGNKFRLNEHLRSKHGYEKYKCAECEFQSASLLAMKNHERRHRGEKPYVCECCGARFHAAYLLAQHRQSHRTDKPLKCDLCPASFKANNSLHMHKASCHSDTTYKCTLCGRGYGCRSYALKHLRGVHGCSGPDDVKHVTAFEGKQSGVVEFEGKRSGVVEFEGKRSGIVSAFEDKQSGFVSAFKGKQSGVVEFEGKRRVVAAFEDKQSGIVNAFEGKQSGIGTEFEGKTGGIVTLIKGKQSEPE